MLFGEDAPCARDDIHGIAHITGGGLSNLLRLNDSVGFEIDNPLIPQPEFEWIQKEGGGDIMGNAQGVQHGDGDCIDCQC